MKKILMFACIFILSGMFGTVSAITVGNDIKDRSTLDSATNIAFIDPTLKFPNAGILESFSVWFKGEAGVKNVNTQIYRSTGTPDMWELVYQVQVGITATDPFSLDYTFATLPFSIQKDDVLGWWFGAGAGVIPFDYTGDYMVEWTNYVSQQIIAPEVGKEYLFDSVNGDGDNQKREYSISAEYRVPEPATMLLLGLGLVGLAGMRRKFQN